MKLIELLAPERILVPLDADDLEGAASLLTEALISSGSVADPERVRQLLTEGPPRDVVSVGQAFLLHTRTDAVPDLAVTLGVAPKAIRRQDETGKEARIVILIVAPPKDASQYLQTVSAFARVLGREGVVDAVLSAESPEDVIDAAPLTDIELPGYLTVRDVMEPRRLSVRPDTALGEASKLMVAHRVTAIPVVSETNEVLGLVTHRELLRYLLPMYVKRMSHAEFRAPTRRGTVDQSDPHLIPVREVMDRSVLCVSEDETLAEVATTMINRNVDRFPVVREGALVGFLTRGDIVRRLLGP